MKPVTLNGQVARFRGNGRQLGYPTANIRSDTKLAEGVYFGFADLVDYTNHRALIFVGVPTTLGDDERRVEVHILDIPDVDYYDQSLSVRIEHFYRPNKRFDSVEELITVMHVDEAQARAWFAKNSNVRDT
jgi:riboflavin kinase/FMN adenylyltransferase